MQYPTVARQVAVAQHHTGRARQHAAHNLSHGIDVLSMHQLQLGQRVTHGVVGRPAEQALGAAGPAPAQRQTRKSLPHSITASGVLSCKSAACARQSVSHRPCAPWRSPMSCTYTRQLGSTAVGVAQQHSVVRLVLAPAATGLAQPETLPGVAAIGQYRHAVEARAQATHVVGGSRSISVGKSLSDVQPAACPPRHTLRCASTSHTPSSNGQACSKFAMASKGGAALGLEGQASMRWVMRVEKRLAATGEGGDRQQACTALPMDTLAIGPPGFMPRRGHAVCPSRHHDQSCHRR